MAKSSLHTVIERIYDAALDPEGWEDVAELLKDVFSSPVSGLFIQNRWTQELRHAHLLGIESRYLESYASHYCRTNPWGLAGLLDPGVARTDASIDAHYRHLRAFTETEFYNDWAEPQGLRYVMGGAVKAFGPDNVNFTFARDARRGPYQAEELQSFDLLKGHLGRAVEISARLEHLDLQVRAQSELLEQLPVAVILLDDQQRIVSANARAEGLLAAGDTLIGAEGGVSGRTRRDDEALRQAVQGALRFRRGETTSQPYSCSMTGPDGQARLSVVAVPLSQDRPLLNEASAAVAMFVTQPEASLPVDPGRVQASYGLTPTEARIAAEMAKGEEPKRIAQRLGVSYGTIRVHLQNVFQKTGTHRQTELVGLLLADWTLSVCGDG